MSALHPPIEEQEWFGTPALQQLFNLSRSAIHYWRISGKIRKLKRASKRRLLCPRDEVIRLLKLEDRSVPGLWTRSPRVLFVDDNVAIRRLVQEKFERIPIELKTAGTIETGLTIAKAFKPDVVILDHIIKNPTKRQGADPALAFMARLKGKKIGHPRVIGISADLSAGPAMREAGAAAFLAKPVKLEELKNLIFRVSSIERRRRRHERRALEGVIPKIVAS